jgi:hypothetical protein
MHQKLPFSKTFLEMPKGVVEEVMFPAVPEQWLLALIQEVESETGYIAKHPPGC